MQLGCLITSCIEVKYSILFIKFRRASIRSWFHQSVKKILKFHAVYDIVRILEELNAAVFNVVRLCLEVFFQYQIHVALAWSRL